jgi:hypothetical protein
MPKSTRIDLTTLFPSYAANPSLYSVGTHPNGEGYAQIAQIVSNVLLQ